MVLTATPLHQEHFAGQVTMTGCCVVTHLGQACPAVQVTCDTFAGWSLASDPHILHVQGVWVILARVLVPSLARELMLEKEVTKLALACLAAVSYRPCGEVSTTLAAWLLSTTSQCSTTLFNCTRCWQVWLALASRIL